MSLLDLPPEIVIAVLVHVDFQTVLHCRQVCTLLKDIVDGDTSLQYIIELGAAGMEDGPASDLAPLARLALLREKQSALKTLTWKSESTYRMTIGEYWELYGGVLAQEEGGRKLVLQQLPSVIRGIEGRQWEIPDVGTDLVEITMDPAQDLLVLVEEHGVDYAIVFSYHLKSLLTGAPHSAAPASAVLSHRALRSRSAAHTTRIAGDYLGALLWDELEPMVPPEMLVWNWRTGRRMLHVVGFRLSSFTFLTPHHILLAVYGNNDNPHPDKNLPPRILVVDIDLVSHESVRLRDLDYTCEFLYPELGASWDAIDMSIRSDPAPHSRPQPSLSVPFYVAREERLFVVALHLEEDLQHLALLSFIPSSTFLISLSSLPSGTTRHTFSWADWGPEGSRFYTTPRATVNVVWICYVYGMSFVYLSKDEGLRQTVVVLDFNQRDIRRTLASTPHEVLAASPTASENAMLITEATDLSGARIFKDAVQTTLPYWRRETGNLDQERNGPFDAAMIDEDSLILVSNARSETFRVLSF